jgi:hypothetical protein
MQGMNRFLAITIILVGCGQKNLSEKKETGKKVIIESDSGFVKIEIEDTIPESSYQRVTPDLIWSSEIVKIFGDTAIDRNKIYWVDVKFEPYITFDDFPQDSVNDYTKASLNWDSNRLAYNFRTRIKNGYSSGFANFGGFYTLTYWGCGSPCQAGVLIDRRTGDIYDLPPAALGYDFRAGSRMLIVNKPDSLGFYADCIYCKPEIHIWDEELKLFTQKSPRY